MIDQSDFKVTRLNPRELLLTRTFAAPREKVFDAWTKAERVKQWWDPTGKPLQTCEIDLRPGGHFRWVHAGAEGHIFAGSYSDIDPPHRLSFVVSGLPSAKGSSASLEFSDSDGRTAMRLLMSFASKADCDAILQMRVDVNTGVTLDNLARHLAASSKGRSV